MDNGNDNIFAPGAGGPTSNVVGSDGKPPGSNADIAGRIDPSVARAASGADGAIPNSEPASLGPTDSATVEPAARRGRGRPRKDTAPGAKEEARSVRASFIEKTLYSIHLGLSRIASAPELELDADDAAKLGEAIANVMKYHKITMTPKQEAYGLLLEAAAEVYPAMIASIVIRKQMEAKERAKHRGSTPIRPVPPTPQPAPNANGSAPGFDPFKITIPD